MPTLDDARSCVATMIGAGVLALATVWLAADRARAQEAVGYGPNLEAFAYPYPGQRFAFTSQGQALSMAYMDVASPTPNGRTAVLLHGKNFTAATWEGVIARLTGSGFRVIAVDQIGFGKSTKPDGYQFSFQQLAANTRALVASLGVGRAVVIGHSTGGMLGTRYALMYPDSVERLVLVDPIGLEDWKAKGVPASTIDEWTEREMRTTPELRAELGNYPRLGREAAAAIPGSRLITFPGLGHAPFIQDPAAFDRALLEALR